MEIQEQEAAILARYRVNTGKDGIPRNPYEQGRSPCPEGVYEGNTPCKLPLVQDEQ